MQIKKQNMGKKITVSLMRDLLADYQNGKISFSRMVEMLNNYVSSEPYAVGDVKCSLCGNEWVAVRPADTTRLECYKCGNITEVEAL